MSIVGSEQWMYSSAAGFYDYLQEQSLRFNDNDSAYLSWTPASDGNKKTWTWSGWVKRGNLGSFQNFFLAGTSGSSYTCLFFDTSDKLNFQQLDSSTQTTRGTSLAVFRDVSAWYNIVFAYDSTQATNSNGLKLYVNGVQQTLSFAAYLQNSNAYINSTSSHGLGGLALVTANYFDGYMADVNFIDGQQLDATSFGEFKSGIWIPKDTSGLTFGTNGFRLQFNDTTEASGFNTVTYTGTGSTQSVSGLGLAPDLVWIKSRSGTYSHNLSDSVRGGNLGLTSNGTNAEYSISPANTFDTDGFTLNQTVNQFNASGVTYVAWCWDAGSGSPASNADGSITSTVKANTTYGFSIATYTGTGANATIGHGLGQTPDAVIVKQRSAAGNHWVVWTNALSGTQFLYLDGTNTPNTNANIWNSTTPTSSVFSVGSDAQTNGSGNNLVAYCFAEKTGYSKIGSYTGTGSSGNSITTGFRPAFIMIKRTDAAYGWYMYDTTRQVQNPMGSQTDPLVANTSGAEGGADPSWYIDVTDTGFTINNTSLFDNASGGSYIYIAFADTRNAAFWKDTSGQGNDWQHNNLTFSDVVLDQTTNNFATWSPLANNGGTLSEGNLKYVHGNNVVMATFPSPSSGKWYWENYTVSTNNGLFITSVVRDTNFYLNNSFTDGVGYYANDGNSYIDGTSAAYGATYGTGDIIGTALNVDDGEVTFYKNGVSQGTLTLPSYDGGWFAYNQAASSTLSRTSVQNFGQDSTFAGLRAAGGNADENGYGDFAYAPPSGFLSLCSQNLPQGALNMTADETPEDYFNTALYTGNGGTQSITGINFQPSLTWIKSRSAAYDHVLIDAVRGVEKQIISNKTDAESQDAGKGLTSFDSDGFTVTLGTSTSYNNSSQTYAAWNWKAGGAGVSNTDGSITSTVSVGATSQQNWFSIVSYTGNGTAGATVGHGLSGTVPDMIIVKSRDAARDWRVYHSSLGATKALQLNKTDAANTSSAFWNNTEPTSSVFSIGNVTTVNGSGEDYIAYCFANAEGLCKVGTYTGNGSTDGTFVYTGFRPSWIMVKRTDAATNWVIWDVKRDIYNVMDLGLLPNASNADVTGYNADALSNGFKLRDTESALNVSGGTYIYLAIASQPFAFANAR